MILLRLNEDKTLTVVSKSKIYQYENNAQRIELLVPKNIEGIESVNFRAWLFGCFETSFGDFIELPESQLYKNSHILFSGRLSKRLTQNSGILKVWITLEYDDFKYESDSIEVKIEESKEIEPGTKIDDFGAFITSINQMKMCEKNCLDFLKMCEENKEQCKKIVELGIEVYESIKEGVININE